jgi:Subtilase family
MIAAANALGAITIDASEAPAQCVEQQHLLLTVQLSPDAKPSCYQALGRLSRPRLIRFGSEDILATIVRREYGRADESLLDYIAAYQPDSPMTSGAVLLPDIGLRVRRGATVRLSPGVTASAVMETFLGSEGPIARGALASLNRRSVESLESVQAGELLKIPQHSTSRTLSLLPCVKAADAIAVVERCGPDAIRWKVHQRGRLAELLDSTVGDVEIPSLLPAEARLALVSAEKTPVDVAVADSGIPADSGVPLWRNLDEQLGAPAVDDDQNGYIDDVHGVNLIDADFRPLDESSRSHGGLIAQIASGAYWPDEDAVGWQNAIVPIKVADSSGVDLSSVDEAAIYAQLAAAGVLNLSLEARMYASAHQGVSETTASQLVVAAAGNGETLDGDRRGINLDDQSIFPASLGGQKSPGVVTVASLGPNEHELASYSNFSPYLVDIAAPGAVSHPYDERGTSFAAALVSWVGGRLKVSGLRTPRQVKTRIIAACAVSSNLKSKTFLGCRLDLRKVFWTRRDVVEATDGRIWVGEILERDRVSIWTEEGARPLGAVRKVVMEDGRGWALLGAAGAFRVERLRDQIPALSIRLESGEVVAVPRAELVDLVTAYQ